MTVTPVLTPHANEYAIVNRVKETGCYPEKSMIFIWFA